MVTIHLPRFKVNTNATEEGIVKLLSIIKPEWPKDEIIITDLSRRSSCCVYKCYITSRSADAIVIKVTSSKEKISVTASRIENEVLQGVSNSGFFARLHAVFTNGYSYDFIPGQPLFVSQKPPLQMKEKQLKQIARCMCGIHSVKIEGVSYTRTTYFSRLHHILEEYYEEKDTLPSKETLRKEIRAMEEAVENIFLPLTLCHGQAHPGNMIWNDEKESVTFIDWDLTHVGYQAAEIAYFLHQLDLLTQVLNFPNSIPENYEEIFLRAYLESWFESTDRKPENVTQDDVDDLASQVHFFKPMVNLSFIITLSFSEEDIIKDLEPEELNKLTKKIYEDYLLQKEEMFA